jgi:hypothetical protein
VNIHQIIAARLRQLEGGAPPFRADAGICYDIAKTLDYTEGLEFTDGYEYCSEIFVELGMDSNFPLPGVYNTHDRWEGWAGAARRELAGTMADHIERTRL